MRPLVIIEKMCEVNTVTGLESTSSFRVYDQITKSVQTIPAAKVKMLMEQHEELFYNARLKYNMVEIEGGIRITKTDVIKGTRRNTKSLTALKRVQNGLIVVQSNGKEKLILEIDTEDIDRIINLNGNLRIFADRRLDFDNITIELNDKQQEAIRIESINNIVNANKVWSIDSKLKLKIGEAKEPYDIVLNKVSYIKCESNGVGLCRRFIVRSGLRIIPGHMFYRGIIEQFEVGPELREIGPYAFSDVPRLKKLDLRKYKNLTRIDIRAFKDSGLEELYLPDNGKYYDGYLDKHSIKVLGLPRNLTEVKFLNFKNTEVEVLILPEAKLNAEIFNIVNSGDKMREIWTGEANLDVAKYIAGSNYNIKIKKMVYNQTLGK